jgi:hypothetical protein
MLHLPLGLKLTTELSPPASTINSDATKIGAGGRSSVRYDNSEGTGGRDSVRYDEIEGGAEDDDGNSDDASTNTTANADHTRAGDDAWCSLLNRIHGARF